MLEIELLAKSRPEKIVGLSALRSFRAHRKITGKSRGRTAIPAIHDLSLSARITAPQALLISLGPTH
jgi:hypothetical protein